MRILFYTFPEGHLVSDKEYESLKKGFAKVGMELIRWHKDKGTYPDIPDRMMVKGWSHTWEEIPKYFNGILGKPVPIIYLSIGTEWKVGATKELNEPIKELYHNSSAVIHISEYCLRSHKAVFTPNYAIANECVIIPAREPNLPIGYIPMSYPLRLATTCIPRPVKRTEDLERLCRRHNIELVPAWGNVSDFTYYHRCHGYIHLSRKEGMPNTVLEALAMGLPCIVTNYGGAKEAVGDAGIVIKNDPEGIPWDPSNIEPVDEHLFKEAIDEFISQHSKLLMRVRGRVNTTLNDYVTACKFKQVFQSLL